LVALTHRYACLGSLLFDGLIAQGNILSLLTVIVQSLEFLLWIAHFSIGGLMKVRPLADRILVKRVEEETKTAGGILIPDNAKEKPMEASVVAVGSGKILSDGKVRPMEIKVGDRVLFSKYSGTEIKLDGVEHLILREDDILGIINN